MALALGLGVLTPAPWMANAADTGPTPQDIDVWLASADIDISIWGMDVWHQGNATATSGFGDMAIAIGDGSNATAGASYPNFPGLGGWGNFAFANGDGSSAEVVPGSTLGYASASGDGSSAEAGAGSGVLDSASASGTGSSAVANFGSFNHAVVIGDHSQAFAGSLPQTHFFNNDFAGAFGDHLTADATGANNLFVWEPSAATDTATAALTAATPDDFGLSDLLNDLGLGGLTPWLDGLLSLF